MKKQMSREIKELMEGLQKELSSFSGLLDTKNLYPLVSSQGDNK
jgi:hypothetical protein